VIDDMTHLGVLDSLARELQENLVFYNSRSNGQTDKATLLALRLEQINTLREILRKQERHLRFMNGEKIEPENHLVEAIITGSGGLEY
jgi:hypothetical protein